MRSRLLFALSSLVLSAVLARPAWADVAIKVDKSSQRMTVSVDGQQRYTWPVSTGASRYDTPNGSYRPFRMERTHFSREWDNAPMPHAIFFTAQGHAIHGTTHGRQLGRPASHGCVRLSLRNAATLFSLVEAQGLANTRVTIERSHPLIAKRQDKGVKVARQRSRDDTAGVRSAGMRFGNPPRETYYYPVTVSRPEPSLYTYEPNGASNGGHDW
ncbi:L,D-transpeptidase [Methylobacterium oxalidis]|uniref:L,D-TPase catalytic domain-containing protein n=1 Tax=Methylobacterium oxalidis TaxID=944322 RepID=A0A512JC32_9HYPH|nr:L,D-transpeptidase [Methylobacterium oxalidis]GEP07510.1 hypothetical protein MOX02_55480 [Methylobacterium oxalidis]GJE35098.1 hypothetical protein LDDCCGHA_5316 [Methylobacterium oxalidis]GLS65197.1 hypothetical protein GCM10007888_35790 [Methylobacterium oxalidis]